MIRQFNLLGAIKQYNCMKGGSGMEALLHWIAEAIYAYGQNGAGMLSRYGAYEPPVPVILQKSEK